MCYVHVTALVAEYLTRKGKKSFCVLWNNCKILQSSKDKREPFRKIWGGGSVCVCVYIILFVCFFCVYSIVCVCVCIHYIVCVCVHTILLLFSHLVMFDSLWLRGACQAPLSMGFPREEYWSALPFPSILIVFFSSLMWRLLDSVGTTKMQNKSRWRVVI